HDEEEDHDDHEAAHGGLERISAVLVGLRSRPDVLRLKREIDEEEAEPLTAALPAVALNELWTTLGYAENALRVISLAVVGVGLISMLIALYSTLQERRREIAVLRAVGLGRREVLALLVLEAGLLATAGAALGVALVYAALFALQPWLEASVGFYLPIRPPTALHLSWLAGLVGAGMAIGLIPAWRAYRSALSDGLAVKL
ncbi:MAG: ABC transporter permease, partial [Acidobacteria bacterium]|nr:ABC transporter permease [Acidobacteriota bacterium]